jgi:hypothetical protein
MVYFHIAEARFSFVTCHSVFLSRRG